MKNKIIGGALLLTGAIVMGLALASLVVAPAVAIDIPCGNDPWPPCEVYPQRPPGTGN